MKRANGRPARASRGKTSAGWDLRLYIAGNTPRSRTALRNLRAICEEHLPEKYRIHIIDLLRQPELASKDQIIATPTLLRRLPAPVRRLIGDLSEKERVLIRLDLLIEDTEDVSER
jgi:circadian clock protein KaiB